MTFDVVMWAKNGVRTLPHVLTRLNRVLWAPGQRLLIDDNSNDGTRAIGYYHGWKVISNEGSGISDGANTALKYVKTPRFASFEQDLLLNKDWWPHIPLSVENKIAVSSGLRFASGPRGLSAIQRFVSEKYRDLPSGLMSRKKAAALIGHTLDNTCYNTEILRETGGFPQASNRIGLDAELTKQILDAGYTWQVHYHIASIHLRKDLMQELKHQRRYGFARRLTQEAISPLGLATRLIMSPASGLYIAAKTREPTAALIHPLMKLAQVYGYVKNA